MSAQTQIERTITRKPEIESTLPLINIVFLLLIFFLVGGTFLSPTDQMITAPTQSVEFEAVEFLPTEWVYANASGDLSYEGEPIAPQALSTALKDGRAVLFADGALTGADLSKILQGFEDAGSEGVMLVTQFEVAP